MASSETKTLSRDPSCPIVGGRTGSSECGTEFSSIRLLVEEASGSPCVSPGSSADGGLELLLCDEGGAAGWSESSLSAGKLQVTQRAECRCTAPALTSTTTDDS